MVVIANAYMTQLIRNRFNPNIRMKGLPKAKTPQKVVEEAKKEVEKAVTSIQRSKATESLDEARQSLKDLRKLAVLDNEPKEGMGLEVPKKKRASRSKKAKEEDGVGLYTPGN